MDETFFDKFIDDIIIKEQSKQKRDAGEEDLTPMQLKNKRRENVGYLIHFNGK